MVIPVPTLSTNGWVRSPALKADYLLSHFFESDHFQTYLYPNGVKSLTYIIEQNSDNIDGVTSALRTALELYLGVYYDLALVDVQNDSDNTVNPGSQCTLRVYAQVTDDGVQYSVVNVINTINSKLDKITKLNNVGQA